MHPSPRMHSHNSLRTPSRVGMRTRTSTAAQRRRETEAHTGSCWKRCLQVAPDPCRPLGEFGPVHQIV
eukprot:15457721-Alexandrium_andersonii.AAC.1